MELCIDLHCRKRHASHCSHVISNKQLCMSHFQATKLTELRMDALFTPRLVHQIKRTTPQLQEPVQTFMRMGLFTTDLRVLLA